MTTKIGDVTFGHSQYSTKVMDVDKIVRQTDEDVSAFDELVVECTFDQDPPTHRPIREWAMTVKAGLLAGLSQNVAKLKKHLGEEEYAARLLSGKNLIVAWIKIAALEDRQLSPLTAAADGLRSLALGPEMSQIDINILMCAAIELENQTEECVQ